MFKTMTMLTKTLVKRQIKKKLLISMKQSQF